MNTYNLCMYHLFFYSKLYTMKPGKDNLHVGNNNNNDDDDDLHPNV